ncbi:ATP-binding cassette domain-containing protein [Agrobacterium tumefaciens]|uniref:ATP-binding cassette domain-containing protein n=1 Tax=Agrobacterium tumefaciens complex TaxID=1183400 RepID=UPI001EEE6165|nr:ATP-binding cassette domain-containing protein [Agrobacterium fabrum]NSZ09704.1 ATP-binding cassette domain-containing protein [Agrobacterium tumefaciens]
MEEVQLGSKLASLEQGLDFLIGERGQLLSGGERQRLAIARAMLGRPKLLILDEASSALDQHTEASIFSNLRKTAKNTIVIAVTHRTNIIQVTDNILDLSSGENDVRTKLAGASV